MFEVLGILTFVAGLVYLWTRLRNLVGKIDMVHSTAPLTVERPDGSETLPKKFPWRQRWQRRRRLWNKTRKVGPGESFWEFSNFSPDSHIWLPVVRRVTMIEITGPGNIILVPEEIVFRNDDQVEKPECAGRTFCRDNKKIIQIELADELPVTRIDVRFTEPVDQEAMEVVLTVESGDKDGDLLRWGDGALRNQNWKSAFRYLESYEEYSRSNPLVCFHLGHLHLMKENWVEAEEYGLRLLSLDRMEPGYEIFNQARKAIGWVSSDQARAQLLTDSAQWEIPAHHGLAALLVHTQFSAGLSGCHREKFHSILEVRRRAAARKLRSVGFSWDGGRTILLHTAVRIIRANGNIEVLPQERFAQGLAEDDNLYITVDRRESGNWILPDLGVGDLVEYTYTLLRRDHGNEAGFFILKNMTDVSSPTLSGVVEVTWPRDWELKFSILNADDVKEWRNRRIGKRNSARFEVCRRPVRTVSGLPYQFLTCNPVLACAKSGLSWSDAADRLGTGNFPPNFDEIELPDELSGVMEQAPDTAAALAQGFYWVRDHIKYGSLHSTNTRIQDTNRASALDETRIGDCKDKTFLMALICRHLEIPCEQVLVSARNGLVVSDLPADQFDHVILRAKVNGDWHYLDAAESMDTFSNIPLGLQGLQGLVLGDGGRLIEIPVDTMAANQLRISENLKLGEESWLESEIELEMVGPFGRFFDEQWKFHSLTNTGENRALENALAMLLPGLTVSGFERLADTGHGDICHLRVQGRRSRLTSLSDRRVALCEILVPSIPVSGYRERELGDEFTFNVCQEVRWRLEVDGGPSSVFGGYSHFQKKDFDFGCVIQVSPSSEIGSVMERRLVVSQRVIKNQGIEDLPEFFEAVEDFCQVVLVFS